MGFRRKLAPDGTPLESVDELPPWRQLIPLGLQHVLAMYAGAVAVPLVVGGALIGAGKLNPGDLGYLVTADLFVAGIATLIQSIGFKWFGVRLPLMQGCTFAAVAPMIVIGSQYGVDRDLRVGDRRRHFHDAAGPAVRQAGPVLPAAGHRHRHPDHRAVADGGGGELGRRAAWSPTTARR